jgi:tetratricopeptide (TPR) repeat protein
MRCKFLWAIMLSTAALAVLAAEVRAAEDVGTKPKDGDTDRPAATATKSKTGVPTLAKRKPAAAALARDPKAASLSASAGDPPAAGANSKEVAGRQSAGNEASPAKATAGESSPKVEQVAGQPKAKTDDEPLKPIPDPMESGPVSIEASSFKGVTPGVSSKEDVVKAWGQPKKTSTQNDELVQLYSVEPFNRVEVGYAGKKVSSVVVRFDRAFPVDTVAKQLDLATIRPVLVSNELGEVLGLAYPERGVLFAFEANKESEKPSMKVAQLVLEPISAEPFVLRAETTLESRCDLSRRDLEQALLLEPDNARAHWLHSRALVTMEQYEKAVVAAGRAVQLEPDNTRYRVTRAQVLAQVGRLPEALAEAQKAAAASEKRPHVKARALCLVGDLLASGAKPDYKQAISFHSQAIQIADPLTSDPHPAVRLAAKEVLVDAHLGAAHDIAWGDWKEKNKAVARWLERALAVANDLVKAEGDSQEQVLRVYVRAMAAYVGLRGGIDPESTVNAAVATGTSVIAATRDPIRKAQLQWDLGMALYDAVQICQMRSDHDHALKYGQQAAEFLAKANETKQSPSSSFLLGRLYFRLGTIHAVRDHDHRAAVVWFDKAIPLLEYPAPEEAAADLGRQGEALVSMGVSYWEAGQRQKALALSEKGIKQMEQAVKQGTLERAALGVPYNNLAAMHRKLGAADKADRYEEMASRTKKEKLK